MIKQRTTVNFINQYDDIINAHSRRFTRITILLQLVIYDGAAVQKILNKMGDKESSVTMGDKEIEILLHRSNVNNNENEIYIFQVIQHTKERAMLGI